jgi:hypothetical protein
MTNWERLLTAISTEDPVNVACVMDDMERIVGETRDDILGWYPLHYIAFMGNDDMLDVMRVARSDMNQVSEVR